MFPLASPRLGRILPGCILQRLIRIGRICPCRPNTSTPPATEYLTTGTKDPLFSLALFSGHLASFAHSTNCSLCHYYPNIQKVLYVSVYCLYLHCVCTVCIYSVYLADIFHFPNILNSLFISSLLPVRRLQPASAQLYCSDISFLQVGASTYTEAGYLDSRRCKIVKLVDGISISS